MSPTLVLESFQACYLILNLKIEERVSSAPTEQPIFWLQIWADIIICPRAFIVPWSSHGFDDHRSKKKIISGFTIKATHQHFLCQINVTLTRQIHATAIHFEELNDHAKMPACRCVVQDCSNKSNPRAGISLHRPKSNQEVAKWKAFVGIHRANFNPKGLFKSVLQSDLY